MQLAEHQLTRFAAELLTAAGVAAPEARQVAESLIAANLCGHESHGVVRIPDYVDQLRRGELVAGAEFHVLHETAGLIAADARFGFGQAQCARLIESTVPKARAQGIACGTLRNCGHVGRLGEWVERVPYFQAVAIAGDGVFDTLKAVSKLVLKALA